ncbi:peptidoglycan-binding protein [Labrenzia sp. OB1]|uniref:peptidoglycan-binding protein n=1 Tax=Labrenzia sp. OB1 TaxID=1561204 RepID=UPI000A64FC39|nr:peptidoglycan-binding protein [Labrenzia sp. OB1]
MDERDQDLDAVADELDRLLSEKDSAEPQRSAGSARQTRHADPAPNRRAPTRARAHDPGVDEVLGALDRLDEQVQGLGGGRGFEEPYGTSSRPHARPGRYAIDSLRDDRYQDPSDPYYDDGHRDAGSENHGEDYYDRAPPPREQIARDRHDASFHVYKDLGRRIDALRAPQEKVLGQVREEIGSLRDALGGISRGTSDTVNRQNTELRRLADMVERLRTDKKTDHLAREIRKEVAELKSMVGGTNVEGALETLEHGYAHILQRLDELSRASVDPRVLRSVTARLDEIEDAFAALPRSEHMVVLEDRVVTIAERVEELLQRKDHVQIEPLRAELREVRGFVEQIDIKGLVEGIDDRMKFVSGRLDDLEVLAREQRGLDTRLSAMEDRMPEPETLARLQGRLEDIVGMMSDDRAEPLGDEHLSRVDRRLDDIVERLERMEHAAPLPSAQSGAFEALEKRLEMISGKIDAIEKKTTRSRPAKSNAKGGGGTDTEFLSELQDRLSDLTARLDQPTDTVTTADLDKLREEIGSMRASVTAPASTVALEQRIADLAQVVSKGGELSDDGRFEQLGEKVAALAEQLENSSGKAFGAEQLSPVLERIEQGLQQSRADVAEIARQAATEAVANLPNAKHSQYDEEINALQGDLRRLLDAAEGGEERTRNTFDGVKSVLGSLTERLDNLERPETVSATPAASFTPLKEDDQTPVFARSVVPASSEEDHHETSAGESVRPDTRARDRKADFIAAARRAAQAASAEAARLDKKPKALSGSDAADEERGKERVGWLRNVLRREKPAAGGKTAPQPVKDLELGTEDIADRDFQAEDARVLPGDRPAPELSASSGGRRRTILYAAAAVVLLIGTLQVYRMTTGGTGDGEQVASIAEKTIESVEALPEDAETDLAAAAAKATAAVQSGQQQSASGSATVSGSQTPQTQPVRTAAAPVGSAVAPAAASTASAPDTQAAKPASDPALESGKVQQASASGSVDVDTELAFAPPAGVASSFGTGKTENPSTFSRSASDKAGKTSTETEVAGAGQPAAGLIANLPPEAIGPMALRSAAASGDPAAEFLVGVKYTEGSGVPADLEKAAVWYQKAANKGLAPAQYRLASLYEKGRGVEKDIAKAKAWYMKAAEAGNAKAMHNLAVLFAEGAGGEPDYAAAGKWFESAANFGVKDSLFNLGILYAGGIGVDKNLVASYKWFAIAADQGDPEAAKRRDDIANMMDQEMLANARLAVENFKLKTPDPAANKVTMQSDWADSAALPASRASVQAVDNTSMIREAQDKLNYLGFDTGTPDGEMGPRTRSAISAFQRSLGLPETGEVDAKLLEELKSQAI